MAPPSPQPRKSEAPAKGSHVPLDRKIYIGRQLIDIRDKLPRGHFQRWLDEHGGGMTMGRALSFMKAARDAQTLEISQPG